MHVDKTRMELSILYFKGPQVEISNFLYLYVPKDCLIIANCADPDEMLHYAAFHLDLHCLPKYLFNSIKNEKCLRQFEILAEI